MINNDGSLLRPYSLIQQVPNHFKDDNIIRTTTIHLYSTHYFVDTIRLTQIDSHRRLTIMPMMHSNFYADNAIEMLPYKRLSKSVINGNISITNWTQLGNNIYRTILPSLSYVNQLFIINQRIIRTRVPPNYSEYVQLVDAILIIYNSWTESQHNVDH